MDNKGVLTICNNHYDLNLLNINFRNSSILGGSIGIFLNTTNIWKNIYKTALIKEQTERNDKISNPSGNDQISDKADALPGQLIPIISKDILPEPRSSSFSGFITN